VVCKPDSSGVPPASEALAGANCWYLNLRSRCYKPGTANARAGMRGEGV
jgi:hypothetical protein